MRFMKFPLLCLLILFTLSGVAEAQLCGPAYSTSEFFQVGNSEAAKPGDTVNIPILLTNLKGVQSLQLYFEYDKTVLTPLFYFLDSSMVVDTVNSIPETTYTAFNNYLLEYAGGRMNFTQDNSGNDFLSASEEFENPSTDPNISRVRLFLNPFSLIIAGDTSSVIDNGDGTIFFMPFVVNPGAVHNTVVEFPIYDIEVKSPVFPYPVLGCTYSRYTDPSTDQTLPHDFRPTPLLGTFTVDTLASPPPVISSFTASPTSITSGGSSNLSWNVTDADSVVINNGVGTFTALNSSIAVSPTVTTLYSITAYNASTTQSSASVTITVGGTVPGNNIPTIAAVTGAPFTVNQGEAVSFTVTASDADASDIITLSALSIPANATFNQAVGSGSVSGNFSFTPDITQSGTFSAVFTATDNAGGTSATFTVIINVIEIQNDRLFSTSAVGQQPVGGLSGKRNIFFPINMVTVQTVYGIQFDFKYDPLFFEVDSFIVTGRTADYVVYDNIGQTPGEIKVVTFGLNNEPIVNVEDTTAVLYAVMSIDSNATPGDYGIYIENGWESINPDPNFPSLELVVDSGVIQVDNPGDVNLDKRIDVADLVNIVASIINTFTLNERQFDVADVITNDTVNVFDLVGIVNLVFGIPLNPNPAPLLDNETATIALAYSPLVAGGNEMIVVNSETPVDLAAVEINIAYDPSAVLLGKPTLAADAQGMSIQSNDDMTGNLKVLVHFTNPVSGARIESGFAEMIEIPMIAKKEIFAGDTEQLRITQANFSTDAAAKVEVDGFEGPQILPVSFFLSQNYPNPFNPSTTIEFSIESNKYVSLIIYNILGRQVRSLVDESMPAGAHSIKWDATNQEGAHVASGVYLYRLTVDDNTQSKKMLLLK